MVTKRLLLAALVAGVAAFAGPAAAHADDSACYAIATGALTGPAATDLSLGLTAAAGCDPATVVQHLQIKTYTEAGKLAAVRNLEDVPAATAVALSRIERGRRIDVQAQVETSAGATVLRNTTTSKLRPELAVKVLEPPLETLTTKPITVNAEIDELNGDTGATATVALAGPIGPLSDPVSVTVPAGGHVPVTFSNVTLTDPVRVEIRVLVQDAAPAEYDAASDDNDARSFSVEVTKSELAASRLLVDHLGGYGAQMNAHLYAPITSAPPASLPDLEAKVKALEPQLVRIFFNERWEWNADGSHPADWPANLQSFKDVVKLANDAGARIVVAYQTIGQAKLKPDLYMTRFADLLHELVVADGYTNVRWAEIGNEPNTVNNQGQPTLTLPQYEALYRALDAQLRVQGVREHIGLMGGDLVQNTEGTPNGHRAWMDYMVQHMNDVLDAWSEHIYWNFNDPQRMEERLKDVAYLTQQELPPSARKPTFIMEFGVRGVTSCAGKPDLKFAYYPDGCQDLRRMPLGAFQKLAFAIASAQLGFDGASYWDMFWSTYDLTKNNQSFWMIGPPEENWALYPSYYAFQLLLQTTAPGWQVLGVDPWNADDAAEPVANEAAGTWQWDQPEQELTAYRGPDGQLTLFGLDTNGRMLTAPDGQSSDYSVGGLPAFTTFTLAEWNANGDGTNSVAQTVSTGPAGVARFSVPLQAAFALTTVPVS
jgi:hypothetical protein